MFRLTHFTIAMLFCLLAAACYKSQAAAQMKMVEGVVISAEAGKLVVQDQKRVNHTHAVDSGTQIMVEGKMAKLEEIRKGMAAHVTVDHGKLIAVSATKPVRDQDAKEKR